MNTKEKYYAIALMNAGEQHRAAGGVGSPPAELVAAELAAVDSELNAATELEDAAWEQQREAQYRAHGLQYTPTHELRNHLAAAGARALETSEKKPAFLRTYTDGLTGEQLRAYAHNQPVITSGPSIDPEDAGNALVTLLTGRPIKNMSPALRAMGEGLNTTGGLLVREQLAATVIDLARAKSRVLQAGAVTLNMESDQCRIARLTTDPTISAVGENAAIPFSDAAFDSITMLARKYGTIVACSHELLSDSPNAGQIIMDALTNAVAAKIDDLLLNGENAFIGLMGDPAVGETGSVGAIAYDDLLFAQWSIRNLNGEPTACILNPKSAYALAILRDVPTGSYLAPPPALAPIQMLDTTRMADTQLVMGDFSQLIFGVRQSLALALSDTAGDSFKNDQTYIRATFRADAAVMRTGAFHKLTGLTY